MGFDTIELNLVIIQNAKPTKPAKPKQTIQTKTSSFSLFDTWFWSSEALPHLTTIQFSWF